MYSLLIHTVYLQTNPPQGLKRQNFILTMRGPDFTEAFCDEHFGNMGITEVEARRIDRSGTNMIFVHLSHDKRARVSAWKTAVKRYNKNKRPSSMLYWAGTTEDEHIRVTEDSEQIRGGPAYKYIQQSDVLYLEWNKASSAASSSNAPRAPPAAALRETPRIDDRTTPSTAPGRAPSVDAPKADQGKAGVLPSVEEESDVDESSEEEMSDVEEAPSCAKVGGKRKFEEDQYYVRHGEGIIRVSVQRTKEYEFQQAAELVSQAAAQARTKEQGALQATEKEKQATVDKQITLAKLQLKLQTPPLSPPLASVPEPVAPAAPVTQSPRDTPAAAAAIGTAPAKDHALVDIKARVYKPWLMQFGCMAGYVRRHYLGANPNHKSPAKRDGHEYYPDSAVKDVEGWIREWLHKEGLSA